MCEKQAKMCRDILHVKLRKTKKLLMYIIKIIYNVLQNVFIKNSNDKNNE
jgi:hypothetical protein